MGDNSKRGMAKTEIANLVKVLQYGLYSGLLRDTLCRNRLDIEGMPFYEKIEKSFGQLG